MFMCTVEFNLIAFTFNNHVDIKNNDGETAVDLARRKGHNDIAEFISNYKSVPKGELDMIVCQLV